MSKPDFKAMAREVAMVNYPTASYPTIAVAIAAALQSAYEAGVADMKERCVVVAATASCATEVVSFRRGFQHACKAIAAAIRSQP